MKQTNRRNFFKLFAGASALLTTLPSSLLASKEASKSAAPNEVPKATGPSSFENLPQFLTPGTLSVIAGRPSMGKTSFLMRLTNHYALGKKKKIAIFSLESTEGMMRLNLICNHAGVARLRLRGDNISEEEIDRLMNAVSEISKSSISINDNSDTNVSYIKKVAVDHLNSRGLDLIIIDYFQLLKPSGTSISRQVHFEVLASELKRLASDLGVPIIVASQVSRVTEEKADKRPKLGSGLVTAALERHSDIFCTLYRESYYDETSRDHNLELAVLKNNLGPTGTLKFEWDLMGGRVHT